jgi:integrase
MTRFNKRIDFRQSDNASNGKTNRKKKKAPSLPPKDRAEANRILDALYDRNPLLGLCCEMSAMTGLRYSDASWLRYDDFYDENGCFVESLTVCQQKVFNMRIGRKEKPLPENLAFRKSNVTVYTNSEIQRIVEDTRAFSNGSEYLFANKRSRVTLPTGEIIDRPMSVESAAEHHNAVKKQLNITWALGTHSWRKYFASLLVKNGATVEKIRDLLGQTSLVSTNAYLVSFSNDLKNHVNQLSLGE